MEHTVYWIHLSDHTDCETEGYVGITNNFEQRMKAHRKPSNSCKMLNNAITLYGWESMKQTIIADGLSEQEALEMEHRLRPNERIGWNIRIGGEKPPSHAGYTHSDSTKALMSKKQKGRVVTETMRRRASEVHKGKKLSEEQKRQISERHAGKVVSEETRQKQSKVQKGKPKGTGKEFIITDPSGKEHRTNSLTVWCQDRDLDHHALYKVARGIGKSHKGHTIRAVEF